MAVVITVTTNSKFKMFSSENATLATAFSEVFNELETHNISKTQTHISVTFDANNDKYAVVAITRS